MVDILDVVIPVPVSAKIYIRSKFPSAHIVGATPYDVVFMDSGLLFALDTGNNRVRALDPAVPKDPSPSIQATRLDIAFPAIRHQEIPGGSLVTFCQVMRPPAGMIGAEPQIVPVSVVFLPGVYLADAVGPDGQKGIYAIRDGLSLADVGLTTPEPTMGGMVMQ